MSERPSIGRRDTRSPWRSDFEAVTGERITGCRTVAGGDIGASFQVDLETGDRLFVKHYPKAPAGQTQAEAEGLRWLAEPGALRIARASAVGRDWLALEWIEPAAPAPDYAEQLGRGLAELHAASPADFGLATDNWIGRLPQSNRPCSDWGSFYRDRRLQPLIERAQNAGQLGGRVARRLDSLLARMPELVGPAEPPARLHGDLWNGNVHRDETGAPCLIDPAVYGGHREVDLAMMRLFGGFGGAVFDAYHDVTPLASGAGKRVALYQVYPYLVHVCLFGGSYLAGLEAAVDAALEAT